MSSPRKSTPRTPRSNSRKRSTSGKKSSSSSRKKKNQQHPNPASTESQPAAVGDTTMYEVESIVDKKQDHGKIYYLLKWKGYPDSSNTWEPASTVELLEDSFIKEFRRSRRKSGGSSSNKKRIDNSSTDSPSSGATPRRSSSSTLSSSSSSSSLTRTSSTTRAKSRRQGACSWLTSFLSGIKSRLGSFFFS